MQSPRDKEHSLTSVAGAQRVKDWPRPALQDLVGSATSSGKTWRAVKGGDGGRGLQHDQTCSFKKPILVSAVEA